MAPAISEFDCGAACWWTCPQCLNRTETREAAELRSRARRPLRTAAEPLPKTESAPDRVFRYLTVPKDDRERPFLARELVKCGKPRCRCAHGLRHGPYSYLRYENMTMRRGTHATAASTCLGAKPRVRRWIRRDRSEVASGRAFMAWLRHRAEAELRAERRAQPPTSRGADVRTTAPTAIAPKSPAPVGRWARVDVVWAEARAGDPENRLETGSGNPGCVGGLALTLPPPSPSRRSAFHPETEGRFRSPAPDHEGRRQLRGPSGGAMSWIDILTESTAALAPSGNPLEIVPPRERAVLVLLGQALGATLASRLTHGPEGGVDLRGRWLLTTLPKSPLCRQRPRDAELPDGRDRRAT